MFHLTPKSANSKTGPIPVPTSSADTCPKTCPLKGNGCYAESGPLAIHWRAVSSGNRGDSWTVFVGKVASLPAGQVWRHNQAGDLPIKRGTVAVIDAAKLRKLTAANSGKRGFTYTHHAVTLKQNREAIREANSAGFTVNLSANNPAHADTLAALDIGPVVTVLPTGTTENQVTPAGRRIVICPAESRDNVTCESCKLCAIPSRRTIIGFPAHGTGKAKASAIASV